MKGDLVQHQCHGVRIKSSNFLIKTQLGPAIFYKFKKIEPFHILNMRIISCSMLLFSLKILYHVILKHKSMYEPWHLFGVVCPVLTDTFRVLNGKSYAWNGLTQFDKFCWWKEIVWHLKSSRAIHANLQAADLPFSLREIVHHLGQVLRGKL